MDNFRPEYIEALDAARWNYWWLVSLLIPPVILFPVLTSRRFDNDSLTRYDVVAVTFVAALFGCWLAFAFAVDYYWDVKQQMAETPAELRDVIADTGRLYGPILVGVPFAVIYTVLVAPC